jgi:hypothetical protein
MIKALLALLLSILAIPVIGVLMLFDYSPNIPIDTYTYVPTQTLLAEQFQSNVSSIQAGELAVQLEESFINQFLYSTFVEQVNPAYKPGPDCNEEACEYLLVNDAAGTDLPVGLTGIWVRLFDDVISVNLGIRSLALPFQTRVRLDFAVTDNPEVFEIEYSRLQLGNIPLPAFVIRPIINAIVSETNLASTVSEGGFLLDLERLVLQVDKKAVIETSLEADAAVFANLIVEEELIRFEVDGSLSRLVLFVDVDKLYSNRTVPEYAGNAEAVVLELLADVLGSLDFDFFEGFGLTTNDYFLSEAQFNEILTAQFAELEIESLIDSEVVGAFFGIKPLWIEFQGSNASLTLPLYFMDELVPVEFQLRSLASSRDLLLEVERITIGRDAQKSTSQYIVIEGDRVATLLAQVSLGDLFSIEPGSRTLRIPAALFNDAIQSVIPELEVTRVAIIDGQLLLEMDLA